MFIVAVDSIPHQDLINIETMFLYRDMEETIHMNLPEGLNKFEGKDENNDADCMISKKYIHVTV